MKVQTAYKIMFREYPDVVTTEQLREMLGNISMKSVYKILKNNTIRSYTIGGRYMIPKVNVIQYFVVLDDV